MAVQLGRRGTYDSVIGTRFDIEDMVNLISPFDVPFLGTYGTERGSVLGSDTTIQTKVEWLEDELVPGADTLTATCVTAATQAVVANQGFFKTNDLIRIDNEFLRVQGFASTDTLNVERSWGTPAADQHTSGAAVLILGTLPTEGDNPVSGINFQRVQPFNITQIYQDEVEVTRTEEKKGKYGVNSEAAYQMAKRLKENAIKLERNIILGTRNDDVTNKRRSMGGLDFYIVTNVDSATTTITEAKIVDQMQAVFNAGGNTDLLACGGSQKRKISAFNAGYVFGRDENIRGSVIEWIDTDFGRSYLILHRWVPTRMLLGLERQYVEMVWFDPFFAETLAKTGDRQQWQVLCEVSMKVKNEKAHFKFTALT